MRGKDADEESNARLMAALFGEEENEKVSARTDLPSHQQLQLNEDGEPVQMRFVYVDEPR